MPTARGSGASKGLVDDYEARLDAHFQSMVSDADFCVPGVVVHLRRGSDIYTKSFGFAAPPKIELNLKAKSRAKAGKDKSATGHSFSAANPYGTRQKGDKRQFTR